MFFLTLFAGVRSYDRRIRVCAIKLTSWRQADENTNCEFNMRTKHNVNMINIIHILVANVFQLGLKLFHIFVQVNARRRSARSNFGKHKWRDRFVAKEYTPALAKHWLFGCSVAWLLGWLVTNYWVAWLLVRFGCLHDWLLGWLLGCLPGWLLGRLFAWLFAWLLA